MQSAADKRASFTDLQYSFTRHIRDPETAPAPPGIEDRRMEIYRGLLYRNVEGFMSASFPVLRKITPDDQWQQMIRDYFSRHQAHTPLFPKMPWEFLQYLENERGEHEQDFPFLLELAHYEWVELALSLDVREISLDKVDTEGDLLAGAPVLSELAWPLSYEYPVHKIRPDYLPQQAPDMPTYIVVYRDRKDVVGFIELNPVSARLLEYLQQQPGMTGRDILLRIAGEIRHPDPEVVVNGGAEILQMLHSKDIILGTQKA